MLSPDVPFGTGSPSDLPLTFHLSPFTSHALATPRAHERLLIRHHAPTIHYGRASDIGCGARLSGALGI